MQYITNACDIQKLFLTTGYHLLNNLSSAITNKGQATQPESESMFTMNLQLLPLLALWIAYGMGRGLRVSTLRLHPPVIIRIYKCGIWTVFEGR